MAGHTATTVDVNGCKTHVRRGGKGAPVVFLHGAGGVSAWAPFMDRLSDRFDLIVPDHPGFGRSDTPDWLDDVQDLAFFYLDFLEAMDLTGVHLVGSAIGGWIAADLAVRNTGRLKSLTLVAAAGIHVKGAPKGDPFMWSEEEHIRNLFHDPKLAEARLAAPRSEEDHDIALKNEFTFARVAWEPRLYSRHLRKWLHRVKLPTLIVWGENDRLLPPVYAGEFQALIPGSKVEIFPACGHLPHVEQADRFVTTFTRFAEEARP